MGDGGEREQRAMTATFWRQGQNSCHSSLRTSTARRATTAVVANGKYGAMLLLIIHLFPARREKAGGSRDDTRW